MTHRRHVCERRENADHFGFFNRVRHHDLWALLILVLCCTPRVLQAATNAVADEEIPPLNPPRAEIPPTFWETNGWWVVLGSALLLALVGLGVWLLVRPKRRPPPPPEAVARHDLAPLREQPETGAVLSRVSQVVRHYFTAAFNLPPHELTTTEFRKAITGAENVGADLSLEVCEFLQQCDERKFSALAPAAPLGAVSRAEKFIDLAEAKRQAALAQEAESKKRPASNNGTGTQSTSNAGASPAGS